MKIISRTRCKFFYFLVNPAVSLIDYIRYVVVYVHPNITKYSMKYDIGTFLCVFVYVNDQACV